MSWTGLAFMAMALAKYGFELEEKVDLGKLGHILFLRWYMTPAAEKMDPLELGRHIDDGLVEYLKLILPEADQDEVDYEKVYSNLRELAEGMMEIPALRAFKEDQWEKEGVPLASETYLELAKRHVNRLTGQGTRKERLLPSYDEAIPFARAMLLPFMKLEFLGMGWNRQGWHRGYAAIWLQERDRIKNLPRLIEQSRKSPVAWDALELISKELAALGETPPQALLEWTHEVVVRDLSRPEEEPAPSHRPRKLGYILRDNELRNTVALLMAVGMSREAACEAVEMAFPGEISTITVQRICAKPLTTLPELGMDAMKFVDLRLFEHQYGSSSDAGSSQSQ